MSIALERDGSLPVLAWVAGRRHGDRQVWVRAGLGVDTFDGGWSEGVWDAPFDRDGFVGGWLAGSGGYLDGDDLVLRPPSHTMESVWFVVHAGALTAANSLPLLLAATGLELDDAYPNYHQRLLGVIYGLRRPVITVPTRGSATIHLVTVAALRVSPVLTWSVEPRPAAAPFRDYHHYRSSLADTVGRVAQMAADPDRRARSPLLATLSSGYDSPACAVLAAEAGCRSAITIASARDRHDVSAHDDSGAALAAPLGLSVVERQRDTRLSVDDDIVAAEFWATGMSGEDMVMRVFADELAGSVLVTGFYGDTVWSTSRLVSTTLRRADVAGASMGELRLRLGFAHLPLPFVGADQHPSIRAITMASEMDPWRVGGGYDRPIPRRIVETAGVDRDRFGRRKLAVTTVANRRRFDDPLVHDALTQFALRRGHTWRTRMLHQIVDVGHKIATPPMRVARPVARKFGWRIDTVRRQSLHGVDGALAFLWSVDHLRHTRYREVTPWVRIDHP